MESWFEDIRDRTAVEVMKLISDGGTRLFSALLMTGKKIL
jgi:hypothetical protein